MVSVTGGMLPLLIISDFVEAAAGGGLEYNSWDAVLSVVFGLLTVIVIIQSIRLIYYR